MKRINLILSAFLIVVTMILVRTTGVEAAATARCVWKTEGGANPGINDFLNGVSATSTNDVWAVGGYMNSSNQTRTLIEHWNGTTWSKVANPNVGTYPTLSAVSADAANDAWAVGASDGLTLIDHWNGTTWSNIASPSPGSGGNSLDGVTAISANNVWAVGYQFGSSGTFQTLIEQWNGTQWSVVSSPNPGSYGNDLNGVTAISATDIWAVGYQSNSSTTTQTLIEHWDGTQWSIVSSPNLGTTVSILYGATAVSANNAWAVGTGNNAQSTLIEHWNGTQWSIVSSPSVQPESGGGGIQLSGIAAASGKDLWTVGMSSLGGREDSIIEHWNGTRWSLVSNPNPGTSFNELGTIAIAPGSSKIWAVGAYSNTGGTEKVLIESHC